MTTEEFPLNNDRVLTIVLCETRGWQVTWESFNRNLLQSLYSDLALCVSSKESQETPFHRNANHIWLLEEPEDWGTLYSREAGNEDWRTLLELDSSFLGGIHDDAFPTVGSGGIIFYFRHFLRSCLLSTGLLETYDWFLIVRSDFVWLAPHPPLHNFSTNRIAVLDGEEYGGVSDRYALIPRELMSNYLEIVEPIFSNPRKLRLDIEGAIDRGEASSLNPEQFLKIRFMALGLWTNLIRIPYFGYAIRLPGGSTRWTEGYFLRTLGYYVKYMDEYVTARAVSKVVKRPSHWSSILSPKSGFFSRKVLLGVSIAISFWARKVKIYWFAKAHDLAVRVGARQQP